MNEKVNAYFKGMVHDGKWTVDYTIGQRKAYFTWKHSFGFAPEVSSNELECDDLPWDNDMADFIQALRESGAEALAVTDRSSGLMHSIHILISLGCIMEGICTVTRTDNRFGETETEEVEGIRFRLH